MCGKNVTNTWFISMGLNIWVILYFYYYMYLLSSCSLGMSKGKQNSVRTLVSRGAGFQVWKNYHKRRDCVLFVVCLVFVNFWNSRHWGDWHLWFHPSSQDGFKQSEVIARLTLCRKTFKIALGTNVTTLFPSQRRRKSFTGMWSRSSKCWKNRPKPRPSCTELKCQRCYQSSTGLF